MSLFTSAAPPRFEVEYCPIDAVTPDPRNPRRHKPAQVRKIRRSIEAFGCVVPLLVNAERQVIAGHGRLLAARQLAMTEVPTIRLEHLSQAQARALQIADNRLNELSSWDDEMLARHLKDLSSIVLDLDVELTGFDIGEIDLRIEGLDTGNDGTGPDPADTLPEAGPAVARLGDLFQLGRHRVLCASALEGASFELLMAGRQAAIGFTDPPYNVPIGGHVSGLGAIRHREFPMATGELSEAEFTQFLATAFGHQARFSTDGAIHYVCMDWRHAEHLLAAARQTGLALKNLCVWAKNAPGMGSLYRSQHELVFVLKHGTAPHRNNVQLGRMGRNRSNLWAYPSIASAGRSGEEGDLLAMHPTVKPVRLVADAILDTSARGDIVLDPFLGSGSTLIAAERMGRCCYGLELDPLHVDTIIRRWQLWSGDSAVHVESGLGFDQFAAESRHAG